MSNRKTALIIGMAKSGIAAAKLLYHDGYRVIINDMKPEIKGLFDALSGIAYEVQLGADPMELLDGVDLIVPSPVIPLTRPFLVEARRRGIEVISEIELGYRYSKADFICITGTNGKTTCTALTGELFQNGGKNTYVLGNIGIAISEHALETKPGDVVVAETAALQLEGNKRFHAKAAGVCNITPDHLDHFGSMENYIAAKAKILDNQTESDVAVLNYDDPIVRDFSKLTRAKVLFFSRRQELDSGMFLRRNMLVYRIDGVERELMDKDDIKIMGVHNLENAMLSALLALSQGIDPASVKETLQTFSGVEHRIEYVCTRSGVDYINDSKGTNPASTIRAIEAMKKPTILILGGYDKHSGFDELFAAFSSNIRACVVLGDTAEKILAAAKEAGYEDICHRASDFLKAVNMARDLAQEGDAVLLSPACASWDMFDNYEQRGRVFKAIVREYK
ncbi:MAG: UDP-N-acetylmuramoyl-L-alanine--D-glutamate ligase [Clostridia bacterium]|nr:UDP-N-acetylmuramoyl-L-alanine--D-glutamate ligase [Clostridia bacterium]